MKYFYLAVLCLVVFSYSCAYAGRGSDFFFVQLADTQLGFSDQNKSMEKDIASFEKAVDHINRLKPAFVVISGDMTNAPGDVKQIEAFHKVVKKIKKGIGVFLVPGNHDIITATKEDVANYNKNFGKDYYSYNCRGSRFIVLNTPLLYHKQADPDMAQIQYNWFEKELKSAGKANHIFVLTHFPWFLENADEPDVYWTVPLTQRKPYLKLMEQYGVKYALAGHYHREALASSNGLTMVTTAPLAVAMGPEPVGLKIFKVYRDRVEFKYYGLDHVPEKIEM